jgi:endonuclease YncB( thermonuclease family)
MDYVKRLVSKLESVLRRSKNQDQKHGPIPELPLGMEAPTRLEDATLETAPLFDLPRDQLIPAKVLEVHDGDTLTAAVELTPSAFSSFRVRLEGVDTPELRPPLNAPDRAVIIAAAERARDFVRSLVLGKVVLITFNGTDKFGRRLARVHLDELGSAEASKTVNDLLIEKGLAKPYYGGKKDT